MMAEFSKKIELKFWDVAIPILTNAVWLQKLTSKFAVIYRDEKLTRRVATVFVIACGGFASGIMAFSITNYLL